MLPTLISMILLASNPSLSLGSKAVAKTEVIASHIMPMTDRYGVESVNTIFKDNILLTLHYMAGDIKSKSDIDWNKVEGDFSTQFTLNPGEEFTFHDKVGQKYVTGNIVKNTNAHFNYIDGFKSDGYLTGDGVCHLASVLDWVATDAGLKVVAPTNHDFVKIPDIPKEYGVGVYVGPDAGENNNLYITNTKEKSVTFVFNYRDNNLTVTAIN